MRQVTQKEYSLAIYRKWADMTEDNDLNGNNIRYHFDIDGNALGYTVNDRQYYLFGKELCHA